MTKPKLKFGPEVTPTGFSAISVAQFSDLRPARIVREVLQNSMDAAVDAHEQCARVRFRVTSMGKDDVPDFAGYRKAFREAVEFGKHTRGDLSTPDQQVAGRIERALDSLEEDGHYLLSIMDNGVGLDAKRMTAILGDGISSKSGDAAGSYGVGHFTAVPTSDLRYVLYGGVQDSGRRTAAGCAFLASRPSPNSHLQAAKGYLIKKFRVDKEGHVYDFISPSDIPPLVANDLRRIRKEWRHGTVIHIPAFNYFDDNKNEWSLWNIVSKVAAYNFAVAIYGGTLAVEVDENDVYDEEMGVKTLDRETIQEILADERDSQQAAQAKSFFAGLRPSGKYAHAILEVLRSGERHVVKTDFGRMILHLLEPSPTGITRLDLFRNGMWITDRLSQLTRSDFTKNKPFHAVLMPKPGGELHRLIRKAEGPLHNEISIKHLGDKHERQNLRDALKAVAMEIKGLVPKLGGDEYTPDDFLVVETGGEVVSSGTRNFSFYGTPVPVQRANVNERTLQPDGDSIPHDETGGGKKEAQGTQRPSERKERPSRPLPFQSTVVPDGRGGHLVSLRCGEATNDVRLSLRLHENVDATCDRIWPDQIVGIKKVAFKALGDGGGKQPKATKVDPEGKEVSIVGLKANETYLMAIEHDGGDRAGDANAPLRVVLHRPPPTENA